MTDIKLPKVYGQGAVFAYSGFEGEATSKKSLVGTLLGDRVGVELRMKTKAMFFISDIKGIYTFDYRAVLSDMIIAETRTLNNVSNTFSLFAVKQNVFVIDVPNTFKVNFTIFDDYEKTENNGILIYKANGETYCYAVKEDNNRIRCSLAFGENAQTDVLSGFEADLKQLEKDRISFYNGLPRPEFENENDEMLYYKCASVLRSMVYTAEDKIKQHWSTPNRFPHRYMWLWDTAYNIIGLRHISCDIAEEAVISMLSVSEDDGFLCHMITPTWHSSITQPPTLAWASLELYKFGKNKAFLEKVYEKLCKYIKWDIKNRDINGNGLLEWLVGDDPYCRCDESGMDNTPRFDEATEMDCIDFNAFLANDMNCLSQIAEILGKPDDAKMWKEKYKKTSDAVNRILWDDGDKFYYDRKLCDNKFHKVKSVASFITLFAGICTKEQAAEMVKHLKNPNEFGTPFPIPTVSADYKTYSSKDMFHGTVWLNFNFLTAIGLEKYGYFAEAKELRRKTLDTIKYWYLNDGVIYEFYDSTSQVRPQLLARKGVTPQPYMPFIKLASVRDFAWGVSFLFDMFNNPSLYK